MLIVSDGDISTRNSISRNTKNRCWWFYSGISSLVGEDLNRIHDSYFYQDYSYEVRIGESLSTYLNELKRSPPIWVLFHLVK